MMRKIPIWMKLEKRLSLKLKLRDKYLTRSPNRLVVVGSGAKSSPNMTRKTLGNDPPKTD